MKTAILILILIVDNLFAQMKVLPNKGDDNKTCSQIKLLYLQQPVDSNINILYGRCLQLQGNLNGAMAAFDRADILDENSSLVHQYMGDLYAKLKNLALASKEYDKADKLGNKKVFRQPILGYEKHQISSIVALGGGYDSNVAYNAKLSDMQNWFNSTTYVTKPMSDKYTKEIFLFTYNYDANEYTAFSYKSQLYIYNKNYTKYYQNDFLDIELLSGANWQYFNLDIWIPLSYEYMATNYNAYVSIYAIKPQIKKRYENGTIIKAEAVYEYQKYLQWKQGNKNAYGGEVGLSKFFGAQYVRIGYRYLTTNKSDKFSSRIFMNKNLNELDISYKLTINSKFKCGLEYLYNQTTYEDLARIDVNEKRKDKLTQYSVFLYYNFTKNTGMNIRYGNYKNSTNYIPSKYSKELYELGINFYY